MLGPTDRNSWAGLAAKSAKDSLTLLLPMLVAPKDRHPVVACAMQNNTQLGFFFFRREDAEAIVEKVHSAQCSSSQRIMFIS